MVRHVQPREDQIAHPNEDLAREATAALGRGDLDALQNQYFAEDIRWHSRLAGSSSSPGARPVSSCTTSLPTITTPSRSLRSALSARARSIRTTLSRSSTSKTAKRLRSGLIQLTPLRRKSSGRSAGRAARLWVPRDDHRPIGLTQRLINQGVIRGA